MRLIRHEIKYIYIERQVLWSTCVFPSVSRWAGRSVEAVSSNTSSQHFSQDQEQAGRDSEHPPASWPNPHLLRRRPAAGRSGGKTRHAGKTSSVWGTWGLWVQPSSSSSCLSGCCCGYFDWEWAGPRSRWSYCSQTPRRCSAAWEERRVETTVQPPPGWQRGRSSHEGQAPSGGLQATEASSPRLLQLITIITFITC